MKDVTWLESHTIKFKRHDDFKAMMEIKDSFEIEDISWTEFIVCFANDEERKKFFYVAVSATYGIREEDLSLVVSR